MSSITEKAKSIPWIYAPVHSTKRLLYLARNFPKYYSLWVYPGHYYSPIPDRTLISTHLKNIQKLDEQQIVGIDINTKEQLKLLRSFAKYAQEMDFPTTKSDAFRYFYENEMYAYGDAAALYSMLRHFKPKRVIEVGSGYSTALMLDYLDKFNPKLEITSIEPYPERLLQQLRPDDLNSKLQLKQHRLEQLDQKLFGKLERNDILFIDSSHVAKAGSDVNFYIFNILPKLNPGVIVHIHDVPWPFEFSYDNEQRYWNEPYIVRAFLTNNDQFEIIFWPSYLRAKQIAALKPIKNFMNKQFGPGAAIWLRKVA